ncbi:MAG: glycosyltransferase family 2 protein [Planctomycetota bacterium]|jgi:cellulose synthase/poly-beta-1,6-N-acetylglucosamine synthase-like glycosyltransferase
MTLFAATTLVVALLGTLLVAPRMARLRHLRPDPQDLDGPATAVVVAARDEAERVEEALRSLLERSGPRTRLVVVDDRSTDATPEILARLEGEFERLQVVRVDALPAGWLGKNHALARGAEAAGDVDWLLFTDADVVFSPGAVEACARHAAERGLDHLTGGPRIRARSLPLAGMVTAFGVLFGLFTQPWRAPVPGARSAVGIGALNLVRRRAYEAAGGHEPLRLCVIDDLGLGRVMKAAGGRSEFVYASELVEVEWYPSTAAMMRGLVKNAYAGVDFRLAVAVAATAVIAGLLIAPFVLPWLPGLDPAARALSALAAALHLSGAWRSASRAGLPLASALLFPFGLTLFLVTLWRSVLTAHLTGAVVWRGTSYPLRDLIQACEASPWRRYR